MFNVNIDCFLLRSEEEIIRYASVYAEVYASMYIHICTVRGDSSKLWSSVPSKHLDLPMLGVS